MTAAQLLAGRNALVLGLDEIGIGIAQRFESAGATVVRLAPTGPSPFGTAAVDTLVDSALQELGTLDVLVCNLLPAVQAGALDRLAPEQLEDSQARIRATLAAMQRAAPALRASGRGRIILVGHRYGVSISDGIAAYNTAAWSLIGLARTAAVEWGQYQVTTNVLLPLARTAEFEAAHAKRPAIVERLVGQLPLRRVGGPADDIGAAAAVLASDLMCFVNGEVIHADGGQHVAGPVLNPARFTT